MADSFTEYLDSLNKSGEPTSFTDYLDTNISGFTDYLDTQNRLQGYSQSVLPKKEDLEPSSPLGLAGAFGSGIVSGATLGWAGSERTPEEAEAMTTGELFAEAFGGIVGGSIPFIAASAITGGYGAPVAGAGYMNRAYKSLKLIKNSGDIIKKAQKARGVANKALKSKGQIVNKRQLNKSLKDSDKLISKAQKTISVEQNKLRTFKKEYVSDLISKGKQGEARRVMEMSEFPQASGLLGRRKGYQQFLEKIAKSDTGFMGLKGFDLANAANRFFSNAATFSAVGLVSNKPGESILGRISDIPKDVLMGGFFAATSLPKMYGLNEKGSLVAESLGITGIGAFGDYLTGEPDENMDIRDRIIHGLSLLTFHHVGQGLSKRGVKEKAYNALKDMGFDEPIALQVAYKTPLIDSLDKASRQKHNKEGIVYKAKKSNTFYAIQDIQKVDDGNGPSRISYVNIKSGVEGSVSGRTLTEAKNNLLKKMNKFDFKDEQLISSLPKELQSRLEQNIDFHRRLETELIKDKDFTVGDKSKTSEYYSQQKGLLESSMSKNNYSKWEKNSIIRLAYPESNGKIENLSARQMERVNNFISDTKRSPKYYESVVEPSIPDGWFTKVASPYYRKALRTVGKVTLPISTFYDALNTRATRQVSKLTKDFVRWRTSSLGTHIQVVNEMQRQLKKQGIKLKDVNEKIQVFMDDKYKNMRKDPEYIKFREKMESIYIGDRDKINALEYVISRYRILNEQMARQQISSNSFIKNVRKNKFEKFIKIVGKDGKEIKLVDYNKDIVLHNDQVTSFIKWAESNGKLKTVIGSNGKRVKVDNKKSHHHYQKDYSRRVISDGFKELMSDSEDVFNNIVRYTMENDTRFSRIRDLGKREEMVRNHLLNIKNMFDNKNIFGQQFTRIANLPTHIYRYLDEGGAKRVIQLPKEGEFSPKGGLYKVGESIMDIHGQKRKISETIPVYEGEYGKLMQNYSEGIAHSTATYATYGTGRANELIIDGLANRVAKEVNDKSFERFTKDILKTQTMGDEANWFSKAAAPLVRWNAIAGLSSPMSGLKNLMLGNVQNATVFTSRELMHTFNHLFTKKGNYKSAKAFAEEIGATYTGAYDLYLGEVGPSGFMKRWLPNLGLMRTTEIMNRTVASALGKHALQIHVANLAGIKLPSTKGLLQTDSRRILLDVFEFTPDQVSDMIYRRRNTGKNGQMQFSSLEEKRAAQQAHTITQGSGELPFVPYWMGKSWAKPLTLFYRIAYRMTESVGKNVVKPALTEGNMVPAMKYIPLSVGSGMALMQVYDWLFDEQRTNQFKSLPAQYFNYFLKAEGMALFSNMYESSGSITFDSYKPVIYRNSEALLDNLVDWVEGKKTYDQAAGDGIKKIVSLFNTLDRTYKNAVGDTQKKFIESRRRQSQYLDAFYPKTKLDIDFDGGLTTKTPHYRMLKDVFWHTDNEEKARRYYTSLTYLSHRIMIEKKGISYRAAEKEAHERLRRTISRLRPIPKSWMETKAQTKGTRYREYLSKLTPEQREQERIMEELYRERKKDFYQSLREFKTKWYKEG